MKVSDLFDVLKNTKSSNRNSKKIIICPKCKSLKIHLSSNFDSWLTPKRYFCEDCGYIGPIIYEIEKLNCE